MPVDLAREILNKELSVPDGQDLRARYNIDLCGGEPLLHFEDLKEIVEYGIENIPRWNKKIMFHFGTNVTLLNDEIKKWLEKNRDWVTIGTSLDGIKKAHDLYRCGTYERVVSHIPFYKRLYPGKGVKMTIGPDTIQYLHGGILNIESMGLNVAANVVFEPVWGGVEQKKQYLREFARQLNKLVSHYADNPGLQLPNLLSLPIHFINKSNDPGYRWCGAGWTMRAYDTDGRVLPCHRFARSCTGKIYQGPPSISAKKTTKCDSCIYACACPNCQGYNWQVNGHPKTRTSYHCEFIKLQLVATAKLLTLRNEQLLQKLIDGELNPGHDRSIATLASLKAANFILHHLREDDIIAGCEIGYP